MKPKTNQWAIEAQPGFKVAAVLRELERENWTHGAVVPVAEFNAEQLQEEVKAPAVSIPFGSTAHELDGLESTRMTASANGHGGELITAK